MRRILLLALFLIPLPSSAATFQKGDTVAVETEDNAYAAGKVVQVSSEAKGDVYLLGETVQINALVRGDTMIAGKNVAINGSVGEDLHAAGMTILMSEIVRGDALLFGQNIVTAPSVRVIGTTFLAGENIVSEGRFEKNVKIFAESATLKGVYNDDVEVHAKNVTIGEAVKIKGNLTLSVPEDAVIVIPDGAVQGEVGRTTLPWKTEERKGFHKEIGIFSLLSKILLGSLVILLVRPFALRYGSDVRKNYWKMFGVGLLTLILPPIAAFLLFLPIITIPVSLLILLMWAGALFIATILSGLVLSHLLLPFGKTASAIRIIGVFVLMTVLLSLLKFLPVFGGLIGFIMMTLSLGAITLYKMGTFKVLRKAGMV